MALELVNVESAMEHKALCSVCGECMAGDEDTFGVIDLDAGQLVEVCRECFHQETFRCQGCGEDFLYPEQRARFEDIEGQTVCSAACGGHTESSI